MQGWVKERTQGGKKRQNLLEPIVVSSFSVGNLSVLVGVRGIDGWFHVQEKVFLDSDSLTNQPCKKLESIWKIICKCLTCVSFKINSASESSSEWLETRGWKRGRLQSMVWIFELYFHACFPAGSALDLLQDVWKCGSLLISDSCYDQWFLSFPIKNTGVSA